MPAACVLSSEEQLQPLRQEDLNPTHLLLSHLHVQLPTSLGGSPLTPPVFDHRAQPASQTPDVDMEKTFAHAHRNAGHTGMLGAGLQLVAADGHTQTDSLEQPEPPAQQALTCRSWRCCRHKYGQQCHCVLWAPQRHTRCAVPAGKPRAAGVSSRQGNKGSLLSSPHPTLLLGLTSSLPTLLPAFLCVAFCQMC